MCDNDLFISAPQIRSPPVGPRRRSSLSSPSRPCSPGVKHAPYGFIDQRGVGLEPLSAISPHLAAGHLHPPTPPHCFAASLSFVSFHDQMDEPDASMVFPLINNGDQSPVLDHIIDSSQVLDKKRRASPDRESAEWRDAAVTSNGSPRKKRKLKSPQVQPSVLADAGSPTSATAVPSRPVSAAQASRPTSATTPQPPRQTVVQPGLQPQPASRPSQPPQAAALPTQSSPVAARTGGQSAKLSHPPSHSVKSATSAEDVVIADVDPAPSPKAKLPAVLASSVPAAVLNMTGDKNKKITKRPPPLASVPSGGGHAGGPTQHAGGQQSSGSGSTVSHVDVENLKTGLPSATVSPVISGFPMHTADKATLDSFRHAQQIKDQQRDLIQKRRQGRAPLTMESPGIGPPPSAGAIPPMMYLHKNSVGSRRSEAVKQKVQGMRVSTSSEGYGRQNGMKTAPVGQSRQSQQPPHATQSSHMRTTAHGVPEDGQDEDELAQDDVSIQRGTAPHPETGYMYSSNRPSQPPASARRPPQTANPNLGGYPQGYVAAPRYADGEPMVHSDIHDHEHERRRSLNGYTQPGIGPSSTRPRSPPASYPSGSVYGSARPSAYPPPPTGRSTSFSRQSQMNPANGPPTAGLSRGEYPPGTIYRPRQVTGYPPANGVSAGSGVPLRARSPGGRPLPMYANGPIDINKEHFMEPFHLLFDTFIDSIQLKKDLELKIRRANDLVEAQEAELRRIAGLRMEFERSLERLQKDNERLDLHPPTRSGMHRGNTSPPPSGGSEGHRAPLAPQRESSERDREVADMRLKLQQMERQPR
ncbi:hypothetical protein QFC19_007738 [Naganishia cerealis]|uniref:Uncharacterized protein n=1 Tax=Naganishia cerealis TaxID=610337 RepID=A0ACC2V7L6_9TREE|nr:hypothetical protein QFC19_007738 [Naganishia cerealis]